MKFQIAVTGFLLITVLNVQSATDNLMARADSLFEQRAAIFDADKMLADKANIDQSITLYKKILDTSADVKAKNEAAWKILQAYFFKALFTTADAKGKVKIFSEGVAVGEKLMKEFPQSVAVNSWFGVVLGYKGEYDSKINSAKEGVPGRVKSIAEKVIALDPKYLDGAGYRMYGRLHYIVPSVPVVMSWPSKKKSIEYLEKACATGPRNLFNNLYLAEVLVDQRQTERAVPLLKSIVAVKEIRHGIALDAFIKRQARQLLEKVSP